MIDVSTVLIEWIGANPSALYTLVGSRIYYPRVPPGFSNSAAALEVFRRGGSAIQEVEEHEASFQIKCYGGTTSHKEAEAVYRALYDRLHGIPGTNTTSGNIMWAYQEQAGQPLFEPDGGWPFVLTFWRVTVRPKA